jgi:hypothetical protein
VACMTLVVGMLKHLAEIREVGLSHHKGIGMALMQVKNLTSKFITRSLSNCLSCFHLLCD